MKDKYNNSLVIGGCVVIQTNKVIIGPFVIRDFNHDSVTVELFRNDVYYYETFKYKSVISADHYKRTNPEYFI